MFVIGTAGHVDHGKSTLVRALTGINPDRLREEQERQMTIDLGFAWLTLPSGRQVSVVDVPGHEDFIKNMLAGVGGIDVALLVVAADEAVMPQTREHLAILDLLQVTSGVVALTKSDLLNDPDWLELVVEDVRSELAGTSLESAAIVPVSALTGDGLLALLSELDRLLDQTEPRRDLGRPRLPIDRVFTITGFGTVVTGTLIDGCLRVGDEVQVVPGDLGARIRGLQTHKTKVSEVQPGARVAANLAGVDVQDLLRGQVVVHPGTLQATTLCDARLRLLASAPYALKHNEVVEVFSGAARASAHLRLLDVDTLEPGQQAWVQLRLQEPMALASGDRFIVRLASPSVTLGGGRIVQPQPGRRYRRHAPEVLARLAALASGTPEERLLQALFRAGAGELRELLKRCELPQEEAHAALQALLADGRALALGALPAEEAAWVASAVAVVARDTWETLLRTASQALASYHARYPLRAGMPREELKSRLALSPSVYNQFIEQAVRAGRLRASAGSVALAEHRITLSEAQQRAAERALQLLHGNPYMPPPPSQIEALVDGELLQYLIESGQLVRVSDDVLFAADAYAEMAQRVTTHLREQGEITVAGVRDLLGTSRKYALGLLEDLDSRRVTRRVGDVRVLR